MLAERMIEANGVKLCTEYIGDPADPPILLVMGIGGSMLWWEEGFCRMLVEGRRFVIRYDHRERFVQHSDPRGDLDPELGCDDVCHLAQLREVGLHRLRRPPMLADRAKIKPAHSLALHRAQPASEAPTSSLVDSITLGTVVVERRTHVKRDE